MLRIAAYLLLAIDDAPAAGAGFFDEATVDRVARPRAGDGVFEDPVGGLVGRTRRKAIEPKRQSAQSGVLPDPRHAEIAAAAAYDAVVRG